MKWNSEKQPITIEVSDEIIKDAKDVADDREMDVKEVLEHILNTESQKRPVAVRFRLIAAPALGVAFSHRS